MAAMRIKSNCRTCPYAEYRDEMRVFCSFCMRKVLRMGGRADKKEANADMDGTAGPQVAEAGMEA